ncbi:hypothetical protein FAES_1818 [Fibrella aestuarina BUZ 2]|uniref:Uncharacterized protein n=1 Tax=Fibrella aestuarina BUZ 2 TaxID=1166018 RepID=I0K6S5_9BACT|nr:hypothetical protein [Fibrella aestuarina]CCG99828.1 hypothetical protein FAES_1818 [Fibrella aestuarina BUZ 2]
MANAEVLPYPELGYGQLSEGHTLRAKLPDGKHLVYTPPLNRDPHEYLAAGATAINVNGGVEWKNQTIGPELRGVCGDVAFIQAYGEHELKGKPLREWTPEDCVACVRMALSDKKQQHRYWTSQAGEAYDDRAKWALPDGSPQMRWITEGFAAVLGENGHHYFDQYRGFALCRSITEDFDKRAVDILRPAFTDNKAALDILRQTTADDFLHEGYKHRDGLISSYYSGQTDPQKFFAGHLTDSTLQLNARRELGKVALDRTVLGFGWYGEFQTMDQDVWHIEYQTPYPDGGYTTHSRPPRYPMPVQVGTALCDFALLNGVFGWESTMMFGPNPRILYPDFLDISGRGKYNGPANPDRAQAVSYYRPDMTAGYPPHPLGYQDAPLVAVNWISQVRWGNFRWCKAKRSASNRWCSNEPTYVIDRYQADEPWCLEGGWGNEGCLLVLDFSGTYGQIRDYDVATSIGQVSFRHTSGSSRLYWLK